jgi:hypothetical protein
VKETLRDYEHLGMRLGGKQYALRVEYRPAEKTARFRFIEKQK